MPLPREQCYQYCETEMSAGTISTLAFLVIADMNLESSVCLAVCAESSGSTSQPLTCNCLKYYSQFHTNNSSASKISLHTLRLSKVYFQKHLKINISPQNTVELTFACAYENKKVVLSFMRKLITNITQFFFP